MTDHSLTVLAVGAALDPFVLIVIMVVFGAFRWYWNSVKRAGGQRGSPRRRGPMPGQSAASRQEELRRLREQNLGRPGISASKPGSVQEKTARELAREVYQQRAEALRAQLSSGSRNANSPGAPAAPGVRQVAQIATFRPARMAPGNVGPAGVSPVRTAPSMGANMAAPIPTAERGAGNVAPRRVGPVPPTRQAGRRPAAPRGAAAPVEAPGAAGTLQRSIAAKAAALKKRNSEVDEDALTSAPVIRAIGKRPAILLMRDSMREAVILREVLDRPVALREPAAPF